MVVAAESLTSIPTMIVPWAPVIRFQPTALKTRLVWPLATAPNVSSTGLVIATPSASSCVQRLLESRQEPSTPLWPPTLLVAITHVALAPCTPMNHQALVEVVVSTTVSKQPAILHTMHVSRIPSA